MATTTATNSHTRPSADREQRLQALWQMTPSQRVTAMRNGGLTMEQCCAWAARYPHQVPLINGEFEFITAHTPEARDDRPRLLHRARGRAPRLVTDRSARALLRPA